ncbi:hypothetical protein SAMN05421823_105240 [Catalinimonas alkaloidigena]|uniref:DUF5777 domain-containing protein n=1 Tax=Catalinimonas alkaloidigena TaxID=1075417 RepID=A0A1G9J8T4_9BACT|nr:DUF5777 family beta-barrel protein [Catalinimonas alkaloidigena]SDL33888.1 hypothetical protein SAMN05421823_105240 [Catalinimonas alkaloidigena]
MRYLSPMLLLLVGLTTTLATLHAQDDLLSALNDTTPPPREYTLATFKSTRIISGHSIETVSARHLDFRISHRFGPLNGGAYNFFGLDQATIRLGLEYGISPRLMLGIGRSSTEKTFDGFVKYKLLRQTFSNETPLSVTVLGATTLNSSLGRAQTERDYRFDHRLTHVAQLLLARKFSEQLSVQLMPTYLHRNLVELATDANDVWALGIGGRMKVTRRMALTGEYYYVLPGSTRAPYQNALALGIDIETGGHVFQLHFTNSLGMVEPLFIARTTDRWADGGIRFGFNISRTFNLGPRQTRAGGW